MAITAIQGVCHDGKIEPLERIPYKTDKKVIIIFLDDEEDRLWEDTVAGDFMKGYSEKDAAYDKL
ncbi:MAG: hypothetical protein H3C64_12915 [Candidatus Kuenenia stuttgartiensis]|jgi:hypothetical protein|uniref:Uncharacterized protein n=1 Tax=Kuenenia stuttgartiensis TaxID=174633 RepID=Q1Q0Z7_KUEST|nr:MULTISPECIES: hypothetical protein [Kuenenia]MBE7547786.1 hypothetical protein [Planctomycetia bacterium]MBW7943253.1 hypothetical protein [Candidatus Kuenenia stuttgartiensis]MBZ0191273.1 hypothetical protein [Candidatus Kuenenia stuttgartiensis]MCF6152496.1 hypothetical protein [Candidatus Kuenenia stuttgartiensis]MCZ7623591.1 hypothetical protein [Candidatus Kuenenia sp.]